MGLVVWRGEPMRKSLCNDNSFLNTGTIGSFKQGWPQICIDGVTTGVWTMESHMEVCLILSCLILNTVSRCLKQKEWVIILCIIPILRIGRGLKRSLYSKEQFIKTLIMMTIKSLGRLFLVFIRYFLVLDGYCPWWIELYTAALMGFNLGTKAGKLYGNRWVQ